MNGTIQKLFEKFNADDIFNSDETGLYYRANPNASLTYEYESFSGSKKTLDRLKVLSCANMSGSGKSAKPLCFKGVNVKLLTLSYYSNSNAWMTSAIFAYWLEE